MGLLRALCHEGIRSSFFEHTLVEGLGFSKGSVRPIEAPSANPNYLDLVYETILA